jgi:hypothetical protein
MMNGITVIGRSAVAASPALATLRSGERIATENFCCTDRLEVIGLVGLAADRMHFEARAAEDVDGERTHATGGASDREWPEFRRLPVVLHAI